MTNNRHRIRGRRATTAPKAGAALHEGYVRAINSALQNGREHVARELAAAYADDLHEATQREELLAA